jgi:hypothetical protein
MGREKGSANTNLQGSIARFLKTAVLVVMGREDDDTMPDLLHAKGGVDHKSFRPADAQVRMDKSDPEGATGRG